MEKEILEFNKRCTEFLGYSFKYYTNDKTKVSENIKFVWGSEEKIFQMCGCWWRCSKNPEDNFSWFFPTDLKFHSDWNLIHEVVEFIKNTTNPKENSDTTFHSLRKEIQTQLGRNNKEGVVDTINDFLIWYEKNKI